MKHAFTRKQTTTQCRSHALNSHMHHRCFDLFTISNDDLKCISLFESLTGATVKDCLLEKDAVSFVVKEGDVGKAIGKGGANIARARQQFNKNVFVFEHSTDVLEFVKNLFAPVPVRDINIQEKNNTRTALVKIDAKNRGSAIGRGGEKIKIARALLLRHFDCDLRLL